MLLKQIYDDDLAQASYIIGCQVTGEAIVIDPRRDIQVYLDEAKKNSMEIVAVSETHIHADYLSGSRELASHTGAKLYLSDEGGEDWQYRFDHHGVNDGDTFKLGNIKFEVLHTPGHTPEHISFLVTDGATTDKPGFLVSGDFVFVGDTGRPDLLDESAGGVDTRRPMASQMFKSLNTKFLTLPDYVQVLPGHGAGSACGKALGAIASSTVGYERNFAWWSTYLTEGDENGFVEALIEGQPDAPVYFGRMKRWNRAGPDILGQRAPLDAFNGEALKAKLDSVTLIDTREAQEFAKGYVPGSINLPGGTRLTGWAAWVIDPENQSKGLLLLASDQEEAHQMRDQLARVGIDNIAGYTTSVKELSTETIQTVAPEALEATKSLILDIRAMNEYVEGHIPNATQLHGGRVMWNLDQLPKDQSIVMHCRTGARVGPVASALRAAGYNDVRELEGSYLGWIMSQQTAVA